MPKIPGAQQPTQIGSRISRADSFGGIGEAAKQRAVAQLGNTIQNIGNSLADQWTKEDANMYVAKSDVELKLYNAQRKSELQKEVNAGNIDENQYVAQLNDDTFNFFKQQVKSAPNKLGEQDFTLRGQGFVDQNYLEAQFFANEQKAIKRVNEADKMFDGIADSFSYDPNLDRGIESLLSVNTFVDNDSYIDQKNKQKMTAKYKNDLATSYLDSAISSGNLSIIAKAKDQFNNHDYLKTELDQDQRRKYASLLDSAMEQNKDNSLRTLVATANNFRSSISEEFGGLTQAKKTEAQNLVAALSSFQDKDAARIAIDEIVGAMEDNQFEKTLPYRITSKRDGQGNIVAPGLDVIDPVAGTEPSETLTANQSLQRAEARQRVVEKRLEMASKDPSRYTQLANRSTQPGTNAHIQEQIEMGVITPKYFSNKQEEFYINTLKNGTAKDLLEFQNQYPEGAVPFLRQVAEEKGGEAIGSEINRVYLASLMPSNAAKSAIMDLRLGNLTKVALEKNTTVELERSGAMRALEGLGYVSALRSENPQLVTALAEAVAAVNLQEGLNDTKKAAKKVLEGTAVAKVTDPWVGSRLDSSVFLPPEAVPFQPRVNAFMESLLDMDGNSKKEAAALLKMDEVTYDNLVDELSFKISPDNTGVVVLQPSRDGISRVPLADPSTGEAMVFRFKDMKSPVEGQYKSFINFYMNPNERKRLDKQEKDAKRKEFISKPKTQRLLSGR